MTYTTNYRYDNDWKKYSALMVTEVIRKWCSTRENFDKIWKFETTLWYRRNYRMILNWSNYVQNKISYNRIRSENRLPHLTYNSEKMLKNTILMITYCNVGENPANKI